MKRVRKITICVVCVLILGSIVNAQKVKTITGTVTKVILSNRWTGLVIKVGTKKYFIQDSHNPSAGDESRGEKPWQVKTIGEVNEGKRVQVSYTKIYCSGTYEDDASCSLKATKIVVIK